MKYLFFKLNAIKYDPISSKEEISMQLEALHLRMRKINALKLEENKAHNQKHWAATLDLIDKIGSLQLTRADLGKIRKTMPPLHVGGAEGEIAWPSLGIAGKRRMRLKQDAGLDPDLVFAVGHALRG